MTDSKISLFLSAAKTNSWNKDIKTIEYKLQKISLDIQQYETNKKLTETNPTVDYHISGILDNYNSNLVDTVINHPVYKYWLKYVPGVDAKLAGHLLGRIAWDKIDDPKQIYTYLGLTSKDNEFNSFLHKKIMNSFKYMINKKSPYTVYYYNNHNRLCKLSNYNDEKNKNVSKHLMFMFLLTDLYYVYNLIVYNKNISSEYSINKINRLVNRNDMLILDNKSVLEYRLDMEKYKLLLEKSSY